MRNILIIVSTLCIKLVLAQNVTFEYPMAESSLLWEIKGDSIPDGSYIYGTIHIMNEDNFFYPDTLDSILIHSDALIMELDDSMFDPEVMQYLILEEGSLLDFFTQEQSDSLLAWAKEKMMIDEETFRMSFDKMKPIVIVQLTTLMQYSKATKSYEIEFNERAKKFDLEVNGLETIADQIGIFDSLTKEEQAELVMMGIRDNDSGMQTDEMEALYLAQNIDSLYMYLHASESVISDKENSFVTERNMKWIPKIEEAIKSKKCFIAVGAGHLGGPNGVIRLLQQQGYELKPVHL